MDIKYKFSNINKKGMLYGVGDLMKYYADVSIEIADKMNELNKNKEIRNKLSEFIRTKTGIAGMTISSMQDAIDSIIAKGDFFYFTVDGRDMCDLLKDKKEVEIQVHMDETYFVTQLAIQKYNPVALSGFRRKYPDTIEGEEKRWQDWFEKQWRKEFKNTNFEKTVLEE